VTEKDLDEHFSQEGKVVECRLVVDPRTRESRGFGFVTMDNADDADRCVKYLNRSTLEGRIITVEKVSFLVVDCPELSVFHPISACLS
jgi:transformer-2 protein